jgi:hypothetical protein
MPAAHPLSSESDLAAAAPGNYVVMSGTSAYFPALALIEAGYAKFLGEAWNDEHKHLVVLHKGTKNTVHGFHENPPGERRAITIGREFFVTALKDYDDWRLKWWREAIQNAVDAGAKEVSCGSRQNPDGTWTVFCEDDGGGMDEDTILNKFLVLGATTKVGESGAAGGFGKAKELLLLPWISWRVHSRDTVIEGAGIDYGVERGESLRGTRLEVVMPADQATTGDQALAFIEKCDLPEIRFKVDGEYHRAKLEAKDLISEVEGKVGLYYTKGKSKQPLLYVRVKGLFMFAIYIGDVPGYVFAEITGRSVDILTANRDGFRDYRVRQAVDTLATKIQKDNLSALKAKQGLIKQKFQGSGKFRARQLTADVMSQIGPTAPNKPLSTTDTSAIVEVVNDARRREEELGEAKILTLPSQEVVQAVLDQKWKGPDHLAAAMKQLVWEPDFYVVNEIEGFHVPKKFFPEHMAPTILKLAKTWTELCRYVLMQLGSTEEFGVGWVFSENTAAAYQYDGEHWLMLNPFRKMTEGDTWHATVEPDLKWIYAAAVHECTHMADGISYHDESFASALTRNMAICADGYRKIRAIAAGIKMRGGVSAD